LARESSRSYTVSTQHTSNIAAVITVERIALLSHHVERGSWISIFAGVLLNRWRTRSVTTSSRYWLKTHRRKNSEEPKY